MTLIIEWKSTLPTLSSRAELDLKEAIQQFKSATEYLGTVTKAELKP